MQETLVWFLGQEDPLERGKATHSSILAWRTPWSVESVGSQGVGHDWATFAFSFTEWHNHRSHDSSEANHKRPKSGWRPQNLSKYTWAFTLSHSWILSCVKLWTVTWQLAPGTPLRPGKWPSARTPFFLATPSLFKPEMKCCLLWETLSDYIAQV